MMSESIERGDNTPLLLQIASVFRCGFYFKKSEVGFRLVFPRSLSLARSELDYVSPGLELDDVVFLQLLSWFCCALFIYLFIFIFFFCFMVD